MHDSHRKELRRPPAATGWSDVPDDICSPIALGDVALGPWAEPFQAQPAPQPGARAAQLAAHRRQQMVHVLAILRGKSRQVRVAVYACVPPGADPAPSLSAAREHAEHAGWVVSSWHYDQTGPDVLLDDRDAWQTARAAVAAGFARGIVTVSRDVLVAEGDHDTYARALEWFETHAAFLQHVPGAGLR